MKLQNAPFTKEFPVDDSEIDRKGIIYGIVMTFACISLIASLVFLILWPIIAWTTWLSWQYSNFIHIALIVWGSFAFSLLLMSVFLCGNKAKAQKRYYKISKTYPLTKEKRQALSMMIVYSYGDGTWSETLEEAPLHWKIAHKDKGFEYLRFSRSIEKIKADLQEYWSINDTSSLQRTIEWLLHGLHAPEFAYECKTKTMFVKDILYKLDFPKEMIDPILKGEDNHPPQLIWAWDLWRAVYLAREGYGAQMLTEEEAWEYILRAYRLAVAIFKTRDDFAHNCLVGHLYWGGESRLEYCKELYTLYQECDWPAKKLPWTVNKPIALPDYVKTGFGSISQ